MNLGRWYVLGIIVVVLALGWGWMTFGATKSSDTTIRVTYSASNVAPAPFMVAESKGFFEKHGVKVESTAVSGPREVALAAGQVDIALGGPIKVLNAIAKGAPIKIVAQMSASPIYLMVRPDGQTKTFADLKGKTLLVAAGGSSDFMMRSTLPQEGVSLDDVEFVDIEKNLRPLALMQQKNVDAVPIGSEDLAKYQEMGAVVHEEWESKGYAADYQSQAVVAVNADFANTNPKLLEKFMDALVEAHKFIEESPDEASVIVAAYIAEDTDDAAGYTSESIQKVWDNKEFVYLLWEDTNRLVEMSNVPLADMPEGLDLNRDQIFDLRFQTKLSNAQQTIYATS